MTHSVLTAAKKLLPKNGAALPPFLDVFFEKVPGEELDHITAKTAAKIAEHHLRLSRERKKGQPGLQIITPCITEKDWPLNCTVIDIVQDDMAFLVDSVVAEIVRHKQTIDYLIHPILIVKKGAGQKTPAYSANRNDKGEPESHIHIQLHGALTDVQAQELKIGLLSVLKDVRQATSDWIPMREKLLEAQNTLSKAPKTERREMIGEYQAFLEYLYDNNFTLLGYRAYKFSTREGKVQSTTIKGSSLGLLSDEVVPVYINEARTGLTHQQQKLRTLQEPMTISKVNKRSTVHRRVPLDAIAIKTYDKKGKANGELLFIGLFTSVTYSRSVEDIPFLRQKVYAVLNKSDFKPQSHNFKALRHILEKYPRDELFQISEEELYAHALSMLRLQERPRIALYMRTDPFGRYISCLIYIPRDRFETRLRAKCMQILEEELGGRCVNFKVTQDDSPMARVIFFIDINHLPKAPSYDVAALESRLIEAGRLWAEQLRLTLEKKNIPGEQVASLIHKFGTAFPVNYHEKYSMEEAVADIAKVQEALESKSLALNLHRGDAAKAQRLRLKIYSYENPIPLSDILPILENMGLKVISELPYEVQPARERAKIWIHDFNMELAGGRSAADLALKTVKDLFETALKNIWDGRMENDSLNRLVLTAQMNWRHIIVLRAYVRYIRQMNNPFSREYIEQALTEYPAIAALIISYFDALHNPGAKGADKKSETLKVEIEKAMESVRTLDFDRILRTMTMLVEKTLRTNFFQTDAGGNPKPYLSFKLKSPEVTGLPEPRPFREIFVYSPRVEGIHLRGDVIARGGIRWSDRHEDFRTEVLGLMKAQMVKNAVIVPMGAKGGFVVKQPPATGGTDAYKAEGVECYKIFIRGLLDITDNRAGASVIPPKNVRRHDGDDPYLVVAADKGTATFSDIANALSLEYGHWLGDAFASGGSAGYDHKVMGITAKGAWESVKRHFRELNHDTQTQDFDVIGVGDMGGDVFGNGMLLSRHIRLIGAFNHMHIFCDPDPDTQKSFAERERLFKGVKGWGEYDAKLLSPGGRIFLRSEKSLTLTPEIQKRFDIAEAKASPNDLIRAMLKARTDLFWFGGIGTYVKAGKETHADVGDKTNDALRIDAGELRAKIIGEGANLAMTHAARIEYAQKGGRCNADFIDNSGGVDSSDHEVNIKILLSDIMHQPKNAMTPEKRNKLLAKMTDEVAAHVLRHNYQQAQAISLIELKAADTLPAHAKLIRELEKAKKLNRRLEHLPGEEEIATRLKNGKGLTRPEICVLLSYAKIHITQQLLNTDIPDTKALQRWVMQYFPTPLRDAYEKDIVNHQLRREIIATMLTGGMVNRMGPTFVLGRMEKCGVSSAEVAKAYIIVRESFGLRPLWNAIEAMDAKVPALVQLRALHDSARMAERAITWFLTRGEKSLNVEREIDAFKDGIAAIKGNFTALLPASINAGVQQAMEKGVRDGLPQGLARDIAVMPLLASACDIIRIAAQHKADIALTAQVYFELGDYFHLDWMRTQAGYLGAGDALAAEALDGLTSQLFTSQAALTVRILKDMQKESQGKAAKANGRKTIVQHWIEGFSPQAAALEPLLGDMRKAANLDLPMLVIAEQRVRGLYSG